jgi:TonB-dependent receptor
MITTSRVAAGLSVSVIALCAAGTAAAQTVPTQPAAAPSEVPQAEDIIVKGIRGSNNSAIRTKLKAVNIMDVVSSDDVKALPDTTIVEALRRIPGLSVLPITDNEHGRDEAATPVIRGLGPEYNNVTLDGMQIASPGTPNGTDGSANRGVRLDLLPASMVSQLQVVKTFTPDLDANAIGGAINIVTRSAFDGGGAPFLTIDAGISHPNDTGRPRHQPKFGPQVTGTASTTFGVDHNIGVVVSANYQRNDSFTDAHLTADDGYYYYYDDAGNLVNDGGADANAGFGNGYAVPQQDKSWYVENTRTRYGVTGKLEARPSDGFYIFGEGGYYYYHNNETRNVVVIDNGGAATVENQTATSGSYPTGKVSIGWAHLDQVSRTRVGLGGFDWSPDDNQTLRARLSYSSASYDEALNYFKYDTGVKRPAPGKGKTKDQVTPNFAIDYDTSGDSFFFGIDPTAYEDLNNYTLNYWRPHGSRPIGNRVFQGRMDYAFNQDSGDTGLGFAAGSSYTDDRYHFAVSRNEYTPNTTAPTLSLVDVAGPDGSPLKYNRDGLPFLTLDPAAALAQVEALDPSQLNQTDETAFDTQDNFTHREQTTAVYGMVSYRSDALDARVGARYDDTRQTTDSFMANETGTFEPIRSKSHYGYLLPSGLVTWHATPTLDLRGAISRTLGRPSYESYAARSAIDFENVGDVGNPDAQGVSVSEGNPDIKPRLSTNYDVAVDWRLADRYGGLISLALFDKQISNEILTTTSIGYQDPGGVYYQNAQVTRPVNANKAHVRGVEFSAIVNSLEFLTPMLKNFGLSGNIASLHGGVGVDMDDGSRRTIGGLTGQPTYTANASAFYTHAGLELRVAYNRQGRAVRSISTSAEWQDLYWAPRDQLDLTARYDVTKALSLVMQVSNLTHSRITSLVGPDKNLLKDSYSMPTTYMFTVRFTPHL